MKHKFYGNAATFQIIKKGNKGSLEKLLTYTAFSSALFCFAVSVTSAQTVTPTQFDPFVDPIVGPQNAPEFVTAVPIPEETITVEDAEEFADAIDEFTEDLEGDFDDLVTVLSDPGALDLTAGAVAAGTGVNLATVEYAFDEGGLDADGSGALSLAELDLNGDGIVDTSDDSEDLEVFNNLKVDAFVATNPEISLSPEGAFCAEQLDSTITGLDATTSALGIASTAISLATNIFGLDEPGEIAADSVGLAGEIVDSVNVSIQADQNDLPECNTTFTGTITGLANLRTGLGISAFDNAITLGNLDGVSFESGITIGGGEFAGAGTGGAQANTNTATAIAIGNGANAEGNNATAIGTNANAVGENATALGANSNAVGDNATAVGAGANAEGENTSAFGANSSVSSENGTAVGAGAIVNVLSTNGSAFGASASASGAETTAIGAGASANGSNVTAIGASASAGSGLLGGNATAVGATATAAGGGATAVGFGATAGGVNDAVFGIGSNSGTGGNNSLFGNNNTVTTGADNVAVGSGHTIDGNRNTAIGDPITIDGNDNFVAGNDSIVTGNDNVVVGNGNTFGTTAVPISNNIIVGDNNTAITSDGNNIVGDNNTVGGIGDNFVFGDDVVVAGERTIAIGQGVNTVSLDTIGIGTNAVVAGDNAIAFGNTATATAANGTAIGSGANVTGPSAIAVGAAQAGGTNAIAVGTGTSAAGVGSLAIGPNASAAPDGSAAIGQGAVATLVNQQVLGTVDNTLTAPGITSELSRSRQSGLLQLPTTDATGNLASDGGATFVAIAEAQAGIAISQAIDAPSLTGDEKFGIRLGYGNFNGVANAFGASARGILCQNCIVDTGRMALDVGAGVGFSQFFSHRSGTVGAARLGLQFTW